MASPPTIVHSGILRKKPPSGLYSSFKNAKNRHFVLATDHILRYYASPNDTEVKGEIDLKFVVGLEQRENGFVIHTVHRDWELVSVSETPSGRQVDVEEWLRVITECIAPLPGSVASRDTSMSVGNERAVLMNAEALAAKTPQSQAPQQQPLQECSAPLESNTNPNTSTNTTSNPNTNSVPSARAVSGHLSSPANDILGQHLKTFVRKKVSQKKYRFTNNNFDLDLCYITRRIIAMGFPAQGMEGVYRNPLDQVQRFFLTYHPNHYRLYNLCSERNYDHALFEERVRCFPFDDHNPPKLEMVADFCEDLDKYLTEDPENVAAVHCKAGKGRTGTMICCYLLHSKAEPTAEAAMKFYGVMRTSDGKGVTIPSQRRYVRYYATQLAHKQPLTPKLIRILSVKFETIPSFDISGGCDPYFKIFIDHTKVFDQKEHPGSVKPAKRKAAEHVIDVSAHNVIVCGDCKFLFYDQDALGGSDKMFGFWVNTGHLHAGENTDAETTNDVIASASTSSSSTTPMAAPKLSTLTIPSLSNLNLDHVMSGERLTAANGGSCVPGSLRLTKSELDGAVNDKRGKFDDNFAIELRFEIIGLDDDGRAVSLIPPLSARANRTTSASVIESDRMSSVGPVAGVQGGGGADSESDSGSLGFDDADDDDDVDVDEPAVPAK